MQSLGNYSFGGATNVKQSKSPALQASMNKKKLFNMMNNTVQSPDKFQLDTVGPQKSIYELIT